MTLDIRLEYQRAIPISTLIDTILFTVDFNNPDGNPSPNLAINTENTITDILLNI